MATLIRLKRKKSSGNNGIVLAAGEAYYNTVDKHLYIGNTDGEDVSEDSKKHIAQITKLEADDKTISFQIGEDSENVYTKRITAASIDGTVSNAENVTTSINGKAITDIFSGTVAKKAAQLNTARNLTTNLNSTSPGSFNGTANVSIGVSGTLPLANGGTGATTAADALKNLGVNVTAEKLNLLEGATAKIQDQLDSKQASITGGATSITSNNLTVSRALVSDSNGKVAVSDVTSTELNFLDGVTSNVQTQLNNKAARDHGTHVSYGTSAPAKDGTASAGSSETVSRSDHVHPTDDSRAPKSHATSETIYGVATTAQYGHVKISNGDVATTDSAYGLAAGMDHSHSNYAQSSDGMSATKSNSIKIGNDYYELSLSGNVLDIVKIEE